MLYVKIYGDNVCV